jgi:anthranilate phosphoribosyltransferase
MASSPKHEKPEIVSISPLLKRLAYPATADIQVSAEDIASAFALIFEDRLSDIQTAALLTLLHSTGKDKDAAVIAKCSHRMREAATQIDKASLKKAVKARGKRDGNYNGGLVRKAPLISCLYLDSPDSIPSAILSEPAETHIQPSTSRQPRQSLPRHS